MASQGHKFTNYIFVIVPFYVLDFTLYLTLLYILSLSSLLLFLRIHPKAKRRQDASNPLFHAYLIGTFLVQQIL